jgi:peptidoglycan lytic transglycosylase G
VAGRQTIVSIAEELAREREAARRAEQDRRRDVSRSRGIDDLDSLDELDTLDWSADPWDEAVASGSVERLRWQTKSIKWFAYSVLVLVITAILVAGVVGWWYIHQVNPAGDPGPSAAFTIDAADTLETVSDRLQQQGFVDDAGLFRWYTDHHGGLELTPGYYELRTRDHMGNILARLRTPPSETYTKVTFPEGFTVDQIAARLDRDMSTMTAADVMAATADPSLVVNLRPPGIGGLEGLLFPDTYQVSNGETPAHVLGRMLGQTERVLSQENVETKAPKLGMSPYQILVIASMIEREAKTDEDRPKIARVIYNRLANGMPLAIDAAVRYGTKVAGVDPDSIPFDQQRQTPGPYNTYLNQGLPPTPIASAGRASIRAALNPAPNPSVGDPLCANLPPGVRCEYLYYVVADEDGNHAFAVTPEQHEANVQAAAAAGLL